MSKKKEIRQDLYRCSVLEEEAHMEMLYEIHTSSNREELVRFACTECTKCGVGTWINVWQTKTEWEKCCHPLSPKP